MILTVKRRHAYQDLCGVHNLRIRHNYVVGTTVHSRDVIKTIRSANIRSIVIYRVVFRLRFER
jgi:hypothetical protein